MYKDENKQKQYQQEWYKRNKEKILVKSKIAGRKRKGKTQKFVHRYKLMRGCDRCGYKNCVYALDFHHTNPDNKENTVSNLVSNKSIIAKVKIEMRKCILLCRNCHTEEHYKNITA